MIFTRFECPRCQHVFVHTGAEDAFADCPKCQSMALAIGEATGSEGAALPPLASAEGDIASEEEAPAGVFSGLLGESGDGFVPDVTSDDMRVPATLDEMPADDPFDEATRQVEQLPASVLLTRSPDAEAPAPDDDDADDFDPFAGLALPSGEEEQDIHVAPTEVLRPEGGNTPLSDSTQVLENPLGAAEFRDEDDDDDGADAWENGPPTGVPTQPVDDDGADAWENGPPSGVPTQAADDEDDDADAWENGPPPSALPRPPPPGPADSSGFVRPAAFAITRDDEPAATSQPEAGAAPAPFDSGFFQAQATNPAMGGNAPLASEEFNAPVPAEVPAAAPVGAWDPDFGTAPAPAQQPVLLSSLEGQMEGAVSFDDPDAVGLANAFSQLEAAFDGAAASSEPEPVDKALQMAQEAMRLAQVQHSGVAMPTADQLQSPNVPMPPSADEPPRMRRSRERGHLTLSEEAKALAGISIQPEAGSQNLALELTRGAAATPPLRPHPASADEVAPPELTLEPPPGAVDFDTQEVTDPVSRPTRPQGAMAEEEEEGEPTFRGFTALRILLAVVVFLVVGGAVGALTAPEPEKKPVTARDRAEQKYARGNHFYADDRIDDALGEYRGALTLDPTHAPSHRAKAAALAKLQRHTEAARAYYKYLEVAPTAVDANEVREVIARWEGKPGT